MGDTISSPGDPLFYMHHTWIDRLWWKWQAQGLPARLEEIGGSNKPPPINFSALPPGGFPGGPPPFGVPNPSATEGEYRTPTEAGPAPTDSGIIGMLGMTGGTGGISFNISDMNPPEQLVDMALPGDPANVTTMGHVLDMFGLIPNATIADVMDIGGGFLCYDYD